MGIGNKQPKVAPIRSAMRTFFNNRQVSDAEKAGLANKGAYKEFSRHGTIDGKEPSSFKYDKKEGTFLVNYDEPTDKTLGGDKDDSLGSKKKSRL